MHGVNGYQTENLLRLQHNHDPMVLAEYFSLRLRLTKPNFSHLYHYHLYHFPHRVTLSKVVYNTKSTVLYDMINTYKYNL